MDSRIDKWRRSLLYACSGGLMAILFRPANAARQDPIPGAPPPQPGRRRTPGDADDSGLPGPSGAAKKAVLEQHQKDIKKDVERLFELAQDLKNEVEKTDATAVLSMAMLKKAEEIEKLAKQIKDHARG
jgi:hypothetical protein